MIVKEIKWQAFRGPWGGRGSWTWIEGEFFDYVDIYGAARSATSSFSLNSPSPFSSRYPSSSSSHCPSARTGLNTAAQLTYYAKVADGVLNLKFEAIPGANSAASCGLAVRPDPAVRVPALSPTLILS